MIDSTNWNDDLGRGRRDRYAPRLHRSQRSGADGARGEPVWRPGIRVSWQTRRPRKGVAGSFGGKAENDRREPQIRQLFVRLRAPCTASQLAIRSTSSSKSPLPAGRKASRPQGISDWRCAARFRAVALVLEIGGDPVTRNVWFPIRILIPADVARRWIMR
jgi:hypothetical protein